MSGVLFLERLGGRDLALLAHAAEPSSVVSDTVAQLRAEPDRIEELVARPDVFDSLFGRGRDEPVIVVAPFLAFSVLVARTRQELREATFVRDWVGAHRSIPIFDVGELRAFLDDSLRRLFLADLLASYTHVASGTMWVRTARGPRRRRFSELDPLRLAELVDAVPEHERVALYRRLGDLSLFLTGVFPDYTSDRLLGRRSEARLRRTLAMEADDGGAIDLLERIGRNSYRLAWEATEPRDVGLARVVGDVSSRFTIARRILNFLTERHLFAAREQWRAL